MRAALRSLGVKLYQQAERVNVENICRALARYGVDGPMLDLGCGDGATTLRFAKAAHAASVDAVERHAESAESTRRLGIRVFEGDLDRPLAIADGTYGVVTSNQVIEHLADTDLLVSEIFRVLRPGGIAVVSTENLASWHNIAALVGGFAPFSAINYSNRIYPLGNPISIHQGEGMALHDGMVHRRIFTTTSLRELFAGHGFAVRGMWGAGYYPLPASVGRIDTRHAHFITIAAARASR